MADNKSVAWAQKMADVLRVGTRTAAPPPVNGSPSTGAAPPAGGGPAGAAPATPAGSQPGGGPTGPVSPGTPSPSGGSSSGAAPTGGSGAPQAGGDAAILKRRIGEWEEKVAAEKEAAKKRRDQYLERSERFRADFEAAGRDHRETGESLSKLDTEISGKEDILKDLTKNPDPSTQEKAQRQLLERDLARLKQNQKNLKEQVESKETAKNKAGTLVEQERARYQQTVDDDQPSSPQPTLDDIQRMPLRARYTELTGRSAAV